MSASTAAAKSSLPARRKYVPAVGPRLRVLLYVVFALVALLAANAVYLLSIKGLKWITGRSYGDYFYLWMILLHLVLGFVLIVPFVIFGTLHLVRARNRKNRRAVRIGYALFTTSLVILITGALLTRVVGYFDLKEPVLRTVVYWLHVLAPLVAGWLYWLHRLAGPRIKWRVGGAFGCVVGVLIGAMLILQAQDPRDWGQVGSKEGVQYFEPSLVRTPDGNFVRQGALMNDDYCKKCHPDVYSGWFHSKHRFSSFNNPAYLATIAELREVLYERDGNVKASRWCAGCHDPVPFLAGKFDDPDYDIINDRAAHAGITCTVCHGMTHVNSNRGNADYTIEEPLHYPFAYSENPLLQFVNNQLVKAKPEFHKESMLKDFHRTSEFCSTCHKVHLPYALNNYKEFLRGQNHYDSWLLSGVSGHGTQSFYYPPEAKTNCNGCHMPLAESTDFGAKDFDESGKLKIHSHQFPSANTGVVALLASDELLAKSRRHGIDDEAREAIIAAHQEFLKGVMRVDIFGVKEGATIDGQLHAPLRPEVPKLKPGQQYWLETVIRTVKMGHHFTQGTVDSNEVWLDVTVNSGGRIENDRIVGGQTIGRSGAMDDRGEVDQWSHFVNVFMLDRNGNRIDRRNAQDIFTPLYDHQIPPGAGQIAHFDLYVPEDIDAPLIVEVKLQYRKFDKQYLDFVAKFHEERNLPLRGLEKGKPYVNRLPVTTLAVDRIVFPIEGIDASVENSHPEIPAWERWNDYGISMLLEGTTVGGRGELKQAEEAFTQVIETARADEQFKSKAYHGLLNLARVYFAEPNYPKALDVLAQVAEYQGQVEDFPVWTASWLNGIVNKQQGHFDLAAKNLESVLETKVPQRKFDFSRDYRVINKLGETYFEWSQVKRGKSQEQERDELRRQAIAQFEKALTIDSENDTAHYNLWQLYTLLGDEDKSAHHQQLHLRYKRDEQAKQLAIPPAQAKYPHGQQAAKTLVVYPLNRPGAPELPQAAWRAERNESEGGR